MAETPSMHPISTSLPDDLWELFEIERQREDRNAAQHLRQIVRRYFERLDADAKAAPLIPAYKPFQSPNPWPGRSMTVTTPNDPHRETQ